jgi:hypothetical protein
MSEDQNNKPAKSPAAIKLQIELSLKQAKVKTFETELRKKIEEMQVAEKIFLAKKALVEDFMEDNSDLF